MCKNQVYGLGLLQIRCRNVRTCISVFNKIRSSQFKDGWFHTGDIGVQEKSGEIRIIDRKKHIFKLSQGEYVAYVLGVFVLSFPRPEKLENIYISSKYVDQIYIHGDSLRSYVVSSKKVGNINKKGCSCCDTKGNRY
jgi:hypothetical protein